MLFMRFRGENQNIIKTDKHRLIQQISKNITDKGLKNSWCFGEPEWHHQIFIMPIGVLNAVFHLSPSQIITREFLKSSLENILALCSRSKVKDRGGRG